MKHLKCTNIRCVSGYVPSDEAAYLSREVCIYCQLYRKDDRIVELEEKHDILRREHDSAITLLRGMSRNIDAFLTGFASDETP